MALEVMFRRVYEKLDETVFRFDSRAPEMADQINKCKKLVKESEKLGNLTARQYVAIRKLEDFLDRHTGRMW